VNDVAMIERC